MPLQPLQIADREFASRLLLGTGKFSSNESMRDALVASGTEIVTVALRRADLSGSKDPYANILEFIDPERYLLLPNTSGGPERPAGSRHAAARKRRRPRRPGRKGQNALRDCAIERERGSCGFARPG